MRNAFGSSAALRGIVFSTVLCTIGSLVPAASARADQTDPALDGLFERLRQADDPDTAARLEGRIWALWLDAPDEASSLLVRRLQSALAAGELERASGLADELVDSAPKFAEAWNRRATVRYLMGDPDGSVADIRATLALEPRHFGAMSGLGLIFIRRGDRASAIEAFEAVLKISPASENARRSVERLREESERDI